MKNWQNFSPKEAVQFQKEMVSKKIIAPIGKPIKYIGGADIAYNKESDEIYTGIIILDYETMEIVAHSTIIDKMTFPYVPGLLSFREIPSYLKVWDQLPIKPDVLVMDGHGIAHPRRVGAATHFGILTNTPTMGCGKKILVGKFENLGEKKGDFAELIDKNELIGYAFRTVDDVKPVYISPGHLCDFEDCKRIALQGSRGVRIPEPTRQADILVNALRRGDIEAGIFEK